MPSRTPDAALAVASTLLLPSETWTAPCDCSANRPVSKVMVLSVPETGPLTRMASAIVGSFPAARVSPVTTDRERQVSSQSAGPEAVPGSSRLTTDRAAPQRRMAPLGCVVFDSGVQRRRPSLAMIAR